MEASTLSLDEDALVGALQRYGIRYLSDAPEELSRQNVDPAVLIGRLARSDDPRLRHALAALFLTHPELAPVARDVAATLPLAPRKHLVRAYVAAVYLQRLWWTRLQRYLGSFPSLPLLWIDELGLPPPDVRFGKEGLAALNNLEAGFGTGRPRGKGANLGPYFKASQHLLGQLIAEHGAARAMHAPMRAGAAS
jgi:hypothetical protein